MASRLPVVVSDLPALREAEDPWQRRVSCPPRQCTDLARTPQVLKDPAKAKTMGYFNRDRVETCFGAERMVAAPNAL